MLVAHGVINARGDVWKTWGSWIYSGYHTALVYKLDA